MIIMIAIRLVEQECHHLIRQPVTGDEETRGVSY